MDGEWFPQPDQLMESVRMLQALRDPTRSDHPHAVASLDQHVANPAFVMVMMHVFVSGARYQQQGLSNDLRQLAGLVIKNYVFPNLSKQSADVQTLLKRDVVQVLQDDLADIRRTGAILAGKISESFPVSTWSDMMPPILQMLDPAVQWTHPAALEGALQATQRICEDSALKLALDDANRPLDALIPRLLALTASSEPGIRIGALSSYNSLLYLLNPHQHGHGSSGGSASRSRTDSFSDAQDGAVGGSGGGGLVRGTSQDGAGLSSQALGNAAHPLIMHMNAFIARLAALAGDPHSSVRTAVCQAITTISSCHVAVLEPYFADICRFMLVALQDSEECVAIESCEFWAVMIESEDTKGAIAPYLHTLVEHLIGRLYLTAEQMEQERIDEEEENSGEKELNLRPMHHRPSSGQGNGSGGSSADDERDTAEASSRWTLRKQAALLLDTVAQACPPALVLAAALPRIQACFQDPNMLVRESGVLALGALSTGCLEEMAQYVPQLFPFLLQNMQASLPEMRSISCWVLSRYCSLFPSLGAAPGQEDHQGPSAEGQACYVQTLHALLTAMFDANTKVQVAACSAVGVLVEQSFYVLTADSGGGSGQNILVPHLPAVLTAISRAFDQYGVKSSLILIDTIGTIADNVGAELKAPQYTALYLAKLMRRFDALEDFDMRMFPVLECLTSLLAAIGLEAQQYVLAIYSRCLRIASAVFAAHHQHQHTQQGGGSVHSGSGGDSAKSGGSAASEEEHDLPSKDFAICALDVVSALCEGLDDMFLTLVRDAGSNTQDTLFQLMFAALRDPLPELRQCGFSLAGEVSKHAFALLSPAVAGQLLQSCVECVHPDYPLVCNNAAWAAGELALRVGGDFLHPFVAQLMNRLITVLQSAHLQEAIRTNVAVTVGRLAMVDTLEVPALADEYFADWCSVLEMPCPTAERTQAYQGMLSILHQNPNLVLGNKTHIYSLLTALAAWQSQGESPPPEQLQGFRDILLAVRSHNLSMWNRVVAKFGLHYDYPALAAEYQLQA